MKFILLFLEFPEYWTSGIIANYISEHAHILSHFDQEGWPQPNDQLSFPPTDWPTDQLTDQLIIACWINQWREGKIMGEPYCSLDHPKNLLFIRDIWIFGKSQLEIVIHSLRSWKCRQSLKSPLDQSWWKMEPGVSTIYTTRLKPINTGPYSLPGQYQHISMNQTQIHSNPGIFINLITALPLNSVHWYSWYWTNILL